MPKEIVVLFSQKEGEDLIRKHCQKVGMKVEDLRRLIEEVVDKSAMQRRHGLWQAFDEVLDNLEEQDEQCTFAE